MTIPNAVLLSMKLVLSVVWGLQEHGLSAATLGGVALDADVGVGGHGLS